MEIVFVRHAEPEWVKDRLNVDNPPLTMRGFEQAELLGNWAASEHFDEVYVSPLVRTQQTAAPILAALKMALVFERSQDKQPLLDINHLPKMWVELRPDFGLLIMI